MSVAVRNGERSISELFGELATETSTLVRQEVHLATVELTQKAAYAGRQTALIGGMKMTHPIHSASLEGSGYGVGIAFANLMAQRLCGRIDELISSEVQLDRLLLG